MEKFEAEIRVSYSTFRSRNVIEEKPYLSLKNKLKNAKQEEIVPNLDRKKVYFFGNVSLPRDRFKKSFENTNIVRNPETADYIIADFDKDDKLVPPSLQSYYIYEVKSKDGSRFLTQDYNKARQAAVNIGGQYQYPPGATYVLYDSALEKMSYVSENMKKLKFINSIELSKNLVKHGKIQGKMIDNINRLMDSEDKINIKLATSLLCEIDYNSNKVELALLLRRNYTNIRKAGCHLLVDMKNLIGLIESDFGYISECSDLEFFLNLFTNKPDDQEIHNRLVKELSEMIEMPENKKLKIEIVDVEI